MPPEGFKVAGPASERPQSKTLDGASTGFDAFTVRKYTFINMSPIRSLTI